MDGGSEERMAPAAPKNDTQPAETRRRRFWGGVLATLGLGPSRLRQPPTEAVDAATRLAQQRTNLALDRNYLAAERTLMAWIRTALSMISFGFSMAKILQAFQGEKGQIQGVLGHAYSVEGIGYYLVVLGTGGLIAAVVQHHIRVRELRAMGLAPGVSVTLVIAVLLSILGVFAFSSLVLRL